MRVSATANSAPRWGQAVEPRSGLPHEDESKLTSIPLMTQRDKSLAKRPTVVSRLKGWTLCFVWLVVASLVACASKGDRYVEVRPETRVGVEMIPQEIGTALRDLGYDRLRFKDTYVDWAAGCYSEENSKLETRKSSTFVSHSEYRMRFQFQADKSLYVEVRVKRANGRSLLRLYQEGRDRLSPTGEEQLQAIKERLALHFGLKHVRLK